MRRLVVVNEQNQLEGVLSMDGVVLHAETNTTRKADLSADDVLRALKALSTRAKNRQREISACRLVARIANELGFVCEVLETFRGSGSLEQMV